MSSLPDAAPRLLIALALAFAGAGGSAQPTFPGVGRAATAPELAAWDIDVRPDFKGLPPGAGSVAQGQVVWEGQCASCHGVFGEANHVFSPLVGGTSQDDVRSGRVARLNDAAFPGRTTLMKLSTLSTLWDYIRRAMPWTAPKSLHDNEVYAVTAYLLNLGGIVPDGYVLSDANMAATQQLLPNRNGATTNHGLWPGKGLGNGGRPDVQAAACMRDCAAEPRVASVLPDFARNSHGNLAAQQRVVGPQRGADTSAAAVAAPHPPSGGSGAAAALLLARKHNCTACHGIDSKIVGPGFREVAGKYAGRGDAETYLAGKIKAGGQGIWGVIPMPAQALADSDAQAIAQWLAEGARN
jgi:S-disulfanyl-L-cysteine oxidoreductase SoxD